MFLSIRSRTVSPPLHQTSAVVEDRAIVEADFFIRLLRLKDIFQHKYNRNRKPLQSYIQPLILIFEKMLMQKS